MTPLERKIVGTLQVAYPSIEPLYHKGPALLISETVKDYIIGHFFQEEKVQSAPELNPLFEGQGISSSFLNSRAPIFFEGTSHFHQLLGKVWRKCDGECGVSIIRQ